MSNPQQQTLAARHGATPGKLALIAVLVLVLGYVVISQLPAGKTPPAATAAPSKQPTAEPATTETSDIAEDEDVPRDIKPWPEPDLDLAIASDPFSLPAWARVPTTTATSAMPRTDAELAAEEHSNALAKLQELGAAVIVEVDGEPLALVGEMQVRVGDNLNGFRVLKITSAGIVLANERQAPSTKVTN